MNLAAAKHFLRDAEKCGGFYGGQVMKWLIAEVERLTDHDRRLAAQLKQSCDDARSAQPYDEAVMRCEELVKVEDEHDRYKAALTRIASYDFSAFAGILGPVGIAKEALKEVE